MSPLAGRILGGRYELVKGIGEGGLSEVWRALDAKAAATNKGRPVNVAVKIVRPRAMRSSFPGKASVAEEQLCDRFNQEVEINKRLSGLSPHILPYNDSGMEIFDDGVVLFLVMPLIEGGRTLDNVLEEHQGKHPADQKISGGYVSLSRTLHLMMQAGQGLHAAHGAGVVHRDFKPSNALIKRDRGIETAMVMDFGIARYLDAARAEANKKLTQLGCCVGTPLYMSPQQGYGPRPDGDDSRRYDLRNDIWSFGVTLFQFATGRLPFPYEERPVDAVWAEVYHGTISPAKLSDYCEDAPEELERLIAGCLEHELENRPASMQEVLSVLQRVHLNLPSSEQSVSVPISAFKPEFRSSDPAAETDYKASDPPPKRNTPGSSPSIEAVASKLDLAAKSASRASIRDKSDEQAPETQRSAPPPAKVGGSSWGLWLALGLVLLVGLGLAYRNMAGDKPARTPLAAASAPLVDTASVQVAEAVPELSPAANLAASASAKASATPSAPSSRSTRPRQTYDTKRSYDPTSAPE